MSKMIDDLSLDLRKSKVLNGIFNAEEKQFDKLNVNIEDLRLQMDIDTATWGLDIYEKDLGIETDRHKSLEERRSVIKSKMRGSGKVDAALIKIVADSFTNGDVDVLFDGKIGVIFNSIYGVPTNIQDVKDAIDNIKPAHLAITFEFLYRVYSDLSNLYSTYEDLSNSELTYAELLTT